jgi:hypothetical protein
MCYSILWIKMIVQYTLVQYPQLNGIMTKKDIVSHMIIAKHLV